MDPITEVFTPSRSAAAPYTPAPKLPLPTVPTTCGLLESAMEHCARHEVNGEFCQALARVHARMCDTPGAPEN